MKKVAVGSSIVARLAVAAALLFASAADAQTPSPFVPPAPPKPKILRLLAEAYAIDPRSLEDFEHATGWAVAYDSYDPSDSIAEKWREGPYDLVELSGPALTRRIAAGSLAKLDKAKLPFSRAVQPPVAAKLAAYDTAGSYSIAYGWSAFGLLYDADKSAKRIAGAPVSWGQLLVPGTPAAPRWTRRISGISSLPCATRSFPGSRSTSSSATPKRSSWPTRRN